jgi:small subunit ribosomal protein S20
MPSQSGAPLDLAWGGPYVSALLLRLWFPECIRRSTEVAVPRIDSAKKRMRQARVRTAENRTQRSRLRTALKKVRAAAGAEVEKAYAEAVQLLDRAGRKHLIHPNAAARQKSRLAKLVSKTRTPKG